MGRSETRQKFEELAIECDGLIKAGRIAAVATRISSQNLAKVPRGARQSLAKICRRAGLVSLGLRLLQPLIRSKNLTSSIATSGEICEYAVLLSRNGSVQEAIALLANVDTAKSPEALLYLGYCHVLTWEYSQAAAYFKRFLGASSDSYSLLIARVNLVSAYIVSGQLDEAVVLLNETLGIAEGSGSHRLLGNCFELQAQVFLRQSNFTEAKSALKKAAELLGQSQSHDQLLIFKTASIIAALEQKSILPLSKFREEAVSRKHWDSVREADLFALQINFRQELLDHLIFGTPMEPYRKRIEELTGALPSGVYVLGSDSLCLDLNSGGITGGMPLTPGKKIHQVLAALVKDFYIPVNMGTLFADLYPDEYFDVDTSPFRVRQLVMRTRRWLQRNKIPASIAQTQGCYKLTIHGSFGVRIALERKSIDSSALRWEELKKLFPASVRFSKRDVRQKMAMSASTFHRLAEWAIAAGELKKSGIGKATRYQVCAAAAASENLKAA